MIGRVRWAAPFHRYAGAAVVVGLITVMTAVAIGSGLGVALARTRNIQSRFDVGSYSPALPSVVLDRTGRLITEYFTSEKREIVSVYDLPRHLIFAVITKEDRQFFDHLGFSPKGILRAAWNILAGHYFSGGSTISQQVAGNLYEDRSVSTLGRKLEELWWSFQLEKNRSKHEILEIYLNNSEFGHGTYGVEAASQFYFGTSARDIDAAQAAILCVQLSNPATRSMINYPNRARRLQEALLESMIDLGYVDRRTVRTSLESFWAHYDRTRSNSSNVGTERIDRAPEFSEYVRQRFESLFFGSPNLFRDGFVIHSTLDLDKQRVGDRLVREVVSRARDQIAADREAVMRAAGTIFYPLVGVLELALNVPDLDFTASRRLARAGEVARSSLLPISAALALVTDAADLNETISEGLNGGQSVPDVVHGTLLSIENETGYIVSMVGSRADPAGSTLSVVDASVPAGSSLIPLYVVHALAEGVVTPGSMIYDSPVALSGGTGVFTPTNNHGVWHGPVLLRTVVADSLIVPALKVFDRLGPERGMEGLAAMFGRTSSEIVLATGLDLYRIAAGELEVSPMDLTTAYAVMANGGRPVLPIAIRYIEDRHGNVIYSSEERLEELSGAKPVVDERAAYLMTDMLRTGFREGVLGLRAAEVGEFEDVPMAAATGSTPTWTDAWTVGYSPHVTTSVWIGTDFSESSLGRYRTGAVVAGPVWLRYMSEAHRDMPRVSFERPESGLIARRVCAVSGKLPTAACTDGVLDELFLAGTEPTDLCGYHSAKSDRDALVRGKVRQFFFRSPAPEAMQLLVAELETAAASSRLPARESTRPSTPIDLPAPDEPLNVDGNPLLDGAPLQ